uniref:Protein kinase domain-containing protein n=1 Tax=Compsopogon caeruleus TaxID=31354 RepID=A0A7S1T7J7_9RHOD|mmetsp:Transcript_12417/g.25272  ORF Transcript_12417/g.25272 Transcript_12417/m.25272 type:complete len:465 (+) Transcript_12417:233-1627(+)
MDPVKSENESAGRAAAMERFFSSPARHNRYRLVTSIGKGAYGDVVKAMDMNRNGAFVAIKRIRRVLETVPMAKRGLREVKFLRLLQGHENIVAILDILIPSDPVFSDTFVVTELLPTDLGNLLVSKTELTHIHIKSFLYQLLRAVHYMHQCNVFHRDLKPSNILINEKCMLKVCDFGLARAAFANDPDFSFWTNYVATRWYRAPELIVAHQKTGAAIDQWSVGCIFAEMLRRGVPLFPGSSDWHQFQLILQVTGRPTMTAISKIRHPHARAYALELPQFPVRPLESIFPESSTLELDLLRKLLAFDPDERISAEDAMRHPFFSTDPFYHNVRPAKTGSPIPREEFDFENMSSIQELRQDFIKEICIYHPEISEEFPNEEGQPQHLYQYAQVDEVTSRMESSETMHVTLPPETFGRFVPHSADPVRVSYAHAQPSLSNRDTPTRGRPPLPCERPRTDFNVHLPKR